MSLFVIDDVDVNVGADKDDVDAVAVVVVFFLLPTSASPDEFLDSSETWSLLRLLVLHQESEVSICGGNKRIGIILILIRQPKAFSLDNSRRDVNCCLLRLWRRTRGSVVTPQSTNWLIPLQELDRLSDTLQFLPTIATEHYFRKSAAKVSVRWKVLGSNPGDGISFQAHEVWAIINWLSLSTMPLCETMPYAGTDTLILKNILSLGFILQQAKLVAICLALEEQRGAHFVSPRSISNTIVSVSLIFFKTEWLYSCP